MKNHWKAITALGLVAYLLSVAACSKSTDLGLSLVETERSNILFTDTLSLKLSTFRLPAQVTSGQSRTLCGYINDPVFGSTTSGIYMNFRITSTNVTFPNTSFDSLVLMLVYDTLGHYGDVLSGSPSTQTWEVLRMEELMAIQTDYKSDASFSLGSSLASNVQFVPNIVDSVDIMEAGNSARKPPCLRVRLDDALGESLLHPADPAIYNSNENFKNFFKGIYIRPQDGAANNNILRFRSKHTNTKLTLYYKDTVVNNGVVTIEPKKFDFMTDQDAESVTSPTHDYTNTDVLSNDTLSDVVYIQGLNGVGVRIEIPYLNQLGDIIVNHAALVVSAVDGSSEQYPAPNQLVCVERLADSTYDYIDDVLTSFTTNASRPFNLFGGTLDKRDTSNVIYTINLSQFMQRLVEGDVDENAIYLQTSTVIEPNRARIGKENHATKPIKLSLTYTKLD